MLTDKCTFYNHNDLGKWIGTQFGKLYLGISLRCVLSILLPRNIDIASNNYIFNYVVLLLVEI